MAISTMASGLEVSQANVGAPSVEAAREYEYSTIMDVLRAPPGSSCNVYGILVDCSVPRPTKRDWISNARIEDPSTAEHPELDGGVEVLIFAALPETLPPPDAVGDIIRFHRLQVSEYNGHSQLVASVGPRRRSQYCLFSAEAAEGEAVQPYLSSSTNYTMNDQEANLVNLLRAFMAAAAELPPPPAAPNKYLMKIRDLDPKNMWDEKEDGARVPNTFFDICCKVLHVHGEGNVKVLYVWDGTDARPFPPGTDTRNDFADDVRVSDEEDRAELMSMMPSYLPLQECEDVPRLGTALPVVTYGLGKLPRQVPLPEAGQWVKLRNVAACIVNGQLQGLYQKSSKWAPWQPTQEAVQALDTREAEGAIQEWAPRERAELLATTSNPQIPYETIREIHQAAEHGTGTKHRCVVQVVGFEPDEVTSFCNPLQACNLQGVEGEYVYTFRLLFRDATGLIDGLVFAEDGQTFFNGIPAQDLQTGTGLAVAMDRAMMRLMGYDADSYEGPWIECCLRGYSLDRTRPLESRQYRIFDTRLRPGVLTPGAGAA